MYRLVAGVLAGPVLLWLWWRGRSEPDYRRALIERLGFAHAHPSACGGLWIHAASVGEAQAALTLWPSLKAAWGSHAITWTTQTPAARALLIERSEGEIHPFFAPLDTYGAVRRFLSRVQPRMLLLLERELWPEWLWQCEQQAITVVVANARLKQRNVTQWPNRAKWMRERIHAITHLLCADDSSYQSFMSLGQSPQRLTMTGNLKFDQTVVDQPSITLCKALQDRTLVVAASSHADDEDALLANWAQWARANPTALLLVAPRHPQRFTRVAERLRTMLGPQASNRLAIWSQQDDVGPHTQIVLLDTIGDLTQFYPIARICLMGGTWSTIGGHNALEPLAAGCPVLFGPYTQQFPDLYADMALSGAALQVHRMAIWQEVSRVLSNPQAHQHMRRAGKTFVDTHQGSAQRTLAQLETMRCWPAEPLPELALGGSPTDRVWFDPTVLTQIGPLDFNALTHGGTAQALATGSGRGQASQVKLQGLLAVLRHYQRGGLIATIRTNTYTAAPTRLSRAMQEMALLREMRSVKLPVPRPLAARCTRTRPAWGQRSSYRADILVEYLPQTQNLAQYLDHKQLATHIWQAIGVAIAQLHAYSINHTDLNCHNILIGDEGGVWVVDFDKCTRQAGEQWKQANLKRLLRSLRKEQKRRTGFCWEEASWQALTIGYESQL